MSLKTSLNALGDQVRRLSGLKDSLTIDEMTAALEGIGDDITLPDGYTRLQFIFSTGSQYINTGYSPNGQSRIVMSCIPIDVYSGNFCFFCARSAASSTVSDGYTLFSISAKYRLDYYGTSTTGTAVTRAMHTVESNRGTVTVDGTAIISNSAVETSTTMPWVLMASAYSTDATTITGGGNYATMLFFSCQIYDGDTLVRDFVPCTNSSGTVGLYDMVTEAFFKNAGSGAFGSGPEV